MRKKVKPLTKRDIQKLEKKPLGWKLTGKNTKLNKTFTFDEHIDALMFIARVTVHAQLIQHHPDIYFSYRTVKITLTTHEIKSLSKRDVTLLLRIEEIYQKGTEQQKGG